MMSYKEMAEIVTKEVDAILERRRIRKQRIKIAVTALSGMCAVAVIGAVIYSGASPKQLTAPPTNSGIIVTENETKPVSEKTETTTKSVIATAVTTGATNTNKTTTVQTQQTTKPQQTVTSKIQT
ncbi:MAG: hypothetical protein MJ081_08990, partial [Ruminococcus sp.]|nr:hypothetical protein [Ruminococcus sp.]